MISKNEFELLLKQISQIENKIVEIKILNQFDKANEYEIALENIKLKARDISLSDSEESNGLDEISLKILSDLILLNSNVDYYILKINGIIESQNEDKIDAEALEKIKNLWSSLEKHIKIWKEESHNPIEEIEYNKHLGKITLEIIIYQLQIEGVIDFFKVFRYCKKDFLVDAIKKILFEGAKDEFHDEIRKRRLIELAKNASEKDLYDYKLWQQILMIKNVRSRDDHIEILGNILEKDDRKYVIDETDKENVKTTSDIDFYDDSIISDIKKWFLNFAEMLNQKKMEHNWGTNRGPAFKAQLIDEEVRFAREYLDKNVVENVKELIIASNGVAKYNFEKNAKWDNLEKIKFLEDEKNTANINLSPDKTFNYIGNETFANCEKLKEISFGKIQMVGERAFKNCTNIHNLVFSKSIVNICEDAFLGCSNLAKVEFLSEPSLFILDRPQNIINCFRGTNLKEVVFPNIESAFKFAITDCPHLETIKISNIPGITIPFKVCKYRLGRQEGTVAFVGETSLNLWKKRNSSIRFFETENDNL